VAAGIVIEADVVAAVDVLVDNIDADLSTDEIFQETKTSYQ
jgi:hypothetical protein